MIFDAYFFDFDGTIGETGPDIRGAWLSAIRKLGLPVGDFDAVFRVGPSIQETSRMLYPDMTPEERKILENTYKSFYDEADNYRALPYPGMMTALEQLHRADRKIYIVTNKRIKPLAKLVQLFGLTSLCHGIFAPDTVDPENHWKKSPLLALAVRISGISPGRCLMVGDTEIDITCGKECGINTCGVSWGYGDMALLKSSGPDFLISDPSQLP